MTLSFLTILKLILFIMLPVLASMGFSFLDQKADFFRRMKFWPKQIIIGIVFGGLAVIATEFGITIPGAVINVRDAAPICAGLIFGGPAGIIAGAIGGIERWFCVLWGGGTYTRLACSIATVLAGLITALLRHFMFDDDRTVWTYGILVALQIEVIHMLMIFFTNMNDIHTAFSFVLTCSAPMILCNCLSVGLAIGAVSLMHQESLKAQIKRRQIINIFSTWLLVDILVVFALTVSFVLAIQSNTALREAENDLKATVANIEREIDTLSSVMYTEDQLSNIAANRSFAENEYVIVVNQNEIVVSDTGQHVGYSMEQLGIKIDPNQAQNEMFTLNISDEKYYVMYKETEGLTIIAALPASEVFYMRNLSVYLMAFMNIIIFFILFVMVYFLIKKLVVDNIHVINRTLSKITEGELNESISITGNEEFVNLSRDINTTVATLRHYIKDAENRMQKEMEVAKVIQASSLPSVFPPFPDRNEFDIFAVMNPAKEVGGDFYDFYFLDENRLAFLIADVSGKGITGAMFMMKAKAVLKGESEIYDDVEDILSNTNDVLCEGNDAEMFVTCWMGILDLSTHIVTYGSAGHNPPLVRKNGGQFEYLSGRPNFVLGGLETARYRQHEFSLEPGDEILLYTDGVTEATDIKNELYGEERLLKIVNALDEPSCEMICHCVKADIDVFVGEAPQFDDITMLSLKVMK